MSFCSKCSAKVSAESLFCHACGSSIDLPDEGEYSNSIEPIVNIDHLKEIQQNTIKENEVETNSKSNDDLRIFIGKNYNYYLGKWGLLSDSKKGRWNWSAFFLTYTWMLYRKMYLRSYSWMCLTLIFSSIVPFSYMKLTFVVGILVCTYMGLEGNSMYKSHALGLIKDISAKKQPEVEKNNELVRNGGTSKLGVVVGIIFYMLAIPAVVFFKLKL